MPTPKRPSRPASTKTKKPAAKKPSAKKSAKSSASSASALAPILAIDDANDFLRAAVEWVWSVPGRKSVPFDQIAEPGRMIVLLDELVSALDSSGIGYVFDWNIGDHYHEIAAWCAKIGAKRTASYLAAGAALFPRKRVPTDKAKRQELAEPLQDDRVVDVLGPIDDEYREDALEEIPERLRTYLRKNRAAIEKALAPMAASKRGESPDDRLLKDPNRIVRMAQIHEDYLRRERAGELKDPVPHVVRLGDVLELRSKKGLFYVQVTHEHAFSESTGPVARVLEGTYEKRPSDAELRALVRGPTRFHTRLMVNTAVHTKEGVVVARADVPAHAREFPTFLFHWGKTRDGRNVFGTWRGGTEAESQFVGPLRPEHRALAVFDSSTPDSVIYRVNENWTFDEEMEGWGE